MTRAQQLLIAALDRLDFLNAGTYSEIGPDLTAEAIRKYLRRLKLLPFELSKKPG